MRTDRRRGVTVSVSVAAVLAVGLGSYARPTRAQEPSAASEPSPPGEANEPSPPGEPTEPPRITTTTRDARLHPRRGPARWYQISPGDRQRFSVAGHVESQLIGLAFGVRAEALYRPFRPDRGANVRVGVGLQGGPEYFYLPVDVGWRQHFVPHRIVTLELGAGFEQQTFFIPGLRPISRPAFYGEGGIAFRVMPGGWLGAQVVPSFAPLQHPGPGLAVRVGFRWTLGAVR